MLPLRMLYFEDLSVGMIETLKKVIDASAVVGFAEVPGDRNPIHLSEQPLNCRAPVKIGDTVDVSVVVAELMPEKFRARLTCTCSVSDEVVLDGEAWVKVPSKQSGGRPLPRI